jgi:serine/threonine protein kinase
MTPERWQLIRELLHSALQLEPGQRPAYLDRHCSSDPMLRKDVDSFLASEEGMRSSFLESPALAQVAPGRTDPPMALASGTKLGPHEITALLGVGGMGEVYRARDTRLDRTVAIKVLPAHLSTDPLRRQRFEREARAISALQHPNICTLYDVGQQDGTNYLVMEYLEGETLASRLTKGLLPPEQTLRFGIEIADALNAAHHRGIVHRDLKPANIFLVAHGECKVLDFGVAMLGCEATSSFEVSTVMSPAPLTSPGSTVGTIAYMSPEQARGEPLDARTDIFSLGAVLYEMATGKIGFRGKTSAMVFKAILDETPPAPSRLNPALPEQLDEIVGKALQKDRDLRYQSAADLGADLRRLKRDTESGGSAAATRTGSEPRAPISFQKAGLKWRRTLLVAGMLAAVIIALALKWYGGRDRGRQIESRRQITANSVDDPVFRATVSPDGKYLAYADSAGIHLRQIDTGETHALPVPEGLCFR